MLAKSHNKKEAFNKQRGFTLIEVLVASVILFSVIATVSMVYRGAFLSSEKANQHITINGVLPSILANIRTTIREQGNSTETSHHYSGQAWQVNYQWQAQQLTIKSAPEKFDIDLGKMITPPLKYKFWQIELIIEFNGLTKQYQLNELSWTND